MGFVFELAGFFVIALMVAVVLLRAMLRARAMSAATGTDRAMKVYRDQLKEVERDLARGILREEEAERLRLEIARRILDLDKDTTRQVGGPAPDSMRWVAVGVLMASVVGSGLLYLAVGAPGYPDMPLVQRHAQAAADRVSRPRQAVLEAEFAARFPEPEDFPGRAELEPMVAQLRAALANRPLDVTGYALLAQNEARLGNYRAAIEAQVRLIELKGEDGAEIDDYAYLLDLMVIATGGFVSPEAEALIEQLLRRDAQNPVALYYSGRMYAQTGRPDLTFRIWRRLHDISDGDAPWMDEVRGALPELARISGEPRYTLPPRPVPAGERGPSAADIEAAEDMSPEDRAAMIEGMVDGMLARLANDGGSAEDWAQLIRALGVLERREQALDILEEARTVFAPRPDDLALINDAAEAAGLRTPAP